MEIHSKNIMIAGISGGVVLLMVTFIADAIAQIIDPYDLFALGGMRAIHDPLMSLYFLYPFVFAIIAAIVWTIIRSSISGTIHRQAITYAIILFLLVIIPNIWIMVTTMTYPVGFYLSNIFCGIIGYPILGYLNARFNSA